MMSCMIKYYWNTKITETQKNYFESKYWKLTWKHKFRWIWNKGQHKPVAIFRPNWQIYLNRVFNWRNYFCSILFSIISLFSDVRLIRFFHRNSSLFVYNNAVLLKNYGLGSFTFIKVWTSLCYSIYIIFFY